MTSNAMTPNQREGLSAQSTISGKQEYLTSTNHILNVNATLTPVALQDVNLTKVGGVAIALGQTTMAASVPVTIASNQSALAVSQSGTWILGANSGVDIGDVTINNASGAAAVNIQDGGNSITVDGSVSITANSSVNVAQLAGTTTDTNGGVKSAGTLRVVIATDQPQLTNKLLVTPDANSAVNIAQMNGVTVLMGNGVTGTGSQRVTIASDNSAVSGMGVGATGSAVPANANLNGISDAGTTRAVLQAANALNTTGTGIPTAQVIGQFDDVAPTAITENQFGNLRMSANRNLYGTIRDAAGNERGANVTAANALQVDLATVAATATAVNNGTASAGVQRVTIASDSTGNIATIGTSVVPGTAATNLGKAEDAAHTTGDVGVFALGVRNDTLADVTNTTADYSQFSTDIKGRTMVAGAPRALKATAQTQLSNTTTETTILTATASTFHDIYGIILANTGASTTKVSIRDDTAGTVRWIIEVPTLETRGFMLPVDSAIPQTAVNKNWTATCGTATTALEVTLFYVNMV